MPQSGVHNTVKPLCVTASCKHSVKSLKSNCKQSLVHISMSIIIIIIIIIIIMMCTCMQIEKLVTVQL